MPRIVYLCLGSIFTALGFVGVFLPLLPTVPFLLLAVWCFARSSERFHAWLYHHPKYGPAIQAWDRDRVIPIRAKVAACTMMAASMVIMLFVTDLEAWQYWLIALTLLVVAVWVASRPGTARDRGPEPAPDRTFPPSGNPP